MNLQSVFLAVSLVLHSASAWAIIDLTQPPMTKDRLVGQLTTNPSVTTLDQVPALLPDDFLINFILKHGIQRTGERGHLVEAKVSQSADPLAPRAIIWDERTGFTISYNAGNADQTAAHRLDLMSFDFENKNFILEQIDFPIRPGQPHVTTSDCANCHGPNLRPIFAMYPDWPAFYGSDNDELTNNDIEVQKLEFNDYRKFLKEVARTHPRYQPLYSNERTRRYLGVDLYASFPYRPDTSAEIEAVSRAFSFRPELRLGILYNRLIAQHAFHRIKNHRNYRKYADFFLFNLLNCNWRPQSNAARVRWLKDVQGDLKQKPLTLAGGGLDYHQNLALFDLRINDIDIRYNYNSKAYGNRDASKAVMEVGYIGRYFNSYFDGSATIDELLSAMLYEDLAETRASLKGAATPWGLVDKYGRRKARFKLDGEFFRQMDRLGKWIHIPYPKSLKDVHHRESFTTQFAEEHTRLCRKLEAELRS